MTIKSILCHMTNDPRHRDRLEVAIELSNRFSAHLNVVYITTPVSLPAGAAGRAASHVYIAEQTEVATKKAEEIRQELEERFRESPCSHEMHLTEGDHAKVLADYAHLADLVVVGQGAPAKHGHVTLHTPEQVALHAGCPVLILPYDEVYWSPGRRVGTRVMIAWKNAKEAIRAVRDSLAIIEEAEEVHVFTGAGDAEHVSGVDIGQYLSLHGVKAEVHPDIEEHGRIGEQVVARAQNYDVDLIIMGAYGHSTWMEKLFGGVTDHVLSHLDRPILVSH